jgi:hypothetical protein
LRYIGDQLRHFFDPQPLDVNAVQQYLALIAAEQAEDTAEKGGFPYPVRAQNR